MTRPRPHPSPYLALTPTLILPLTTAPSPDPHQVRPPSARHDDPRVEPAAGAPARLLAARCLLLAARCSLLAACCLLPTTHHLLTPYPSPLPLTPHPLPRTAAGARSQPAGAAVPHSRGHRQAHLHLRGPVLRPAGSPRKLIGYLQHRQSPALRPLGLSRGQQSRTRVVQYEHSLLVCHRYSSTLTHPVG